MEKLTKADPDFYRKLNALRKNKVGGQTFKNREIAREAQKRGLEVRLRNAAQRTKAKARTGKKDAA